MQLDEARMLVASGRFLTAGAARSHMDLTLALVRKASPELAALTARYLIVDSRPPPLATSKRTLARRMDEVLGKSPLAYFQDLRVERALHLLKTTPHNMDRIAEMVGYAEGVTLAALLRKKLGRGVRDIRRGESATALKLL